MVQARKSWKRPYQMYCMTSYPVTFRVSRFIISTYGCYEWILAVNSEVSYLAARLGILV